MRTLLKTNALILCIFLSLNGYAQEKQFFNRTLSLDVIPILNLATGGQPSHNELELIYTERVEQKLLRFKVSINDRNVYEDELIQTVLLNSTAVDYTYLVNTYQSDKNIRLSLGLAKIVPNNNLFLYYGLDFNLGLNRGYVNTDKLIKQVGLDEENRIQSKKEAILFAGLTPVLGSKIAIGKRIYFGIEFGIEVNYLFGDIPYLDESMNYQKSSLGRLDFNPIKVINDITFGIKF